MLMIDNRVPPGTPGTLRYCDSSGRTFLPVRKFNVLSDSLLPFQHHLVYWPLAGLSAPPKGHS